MNKLILVSVIGASLFFAACGTTKSPELMKYEARQKVLDLNSDVNKLKIKLEEERAENNKIKDEVESLNKRANKSTSRFNSSDPSSTANDAKTTAKLLNDVEKANKKLERSNKRMDNIQKDIEKSQAKINVLNKQIEFVDTSKQ